MSSSAILNSFMGFHDLADLLVLPPLMPNRVKRQILNEHEIFVYDLSFP